MSMSLGRTYQYSLASYWGLDETLGGENSSTAPRAHWVGVSHKTCAVRAIE